MHSCSLIGWLYAKELNENNGLATGQNKAGNPAGLIVTSDKLYNTYVCMYMDVGILLQGQYLTYCNGAIGKILQKKSELNKKKFGI